MEGAVCSSANEVKNSGDGARRDREIQSPARLKHMHRDSLSSDGDDERWRQQ